MTEISVEVLAGAGGGVDVQRGQIFGAGAPLVRFGRLKREAGFAQPRILAVHHGDELAEAARQRRAERERVDQVRRRWTLGGGREPGGGGELVARFIGLLLRLEQLRAGEFEALVGLLAFGDRHGPFRHRFAHVAGELLVERQVARRGGGIALVQHQVGIGLGRAEGGDLPRPQHVHV